MIKEEQVTTVTTIKHKFCDDCGVEIQRGLSCNKAYCAYCGKDLCNRCIGWEEETPGDYRECYCKSCYEIKLKYKPAIDKLEDEIELLSSQMRQECKTKSQRK